MRVAMFSTKPYDRRSFEARRASFGHEIHYPAVWVKLAEHGLAFVTA